MVWGGGGQETSLTLSTQGLQLQVFFLFWRATAEYRLCPPKPQKFHQRQRQRETGVSLLIAPKGLWFKGPEVGSLGETQSTEVTDYSKSVFLSQPGILSLLKSICYWEGMKGPRGILIWGVWSNVLDDVCECGEHWTLFINVTGQNIRQWFPVNWLHLLCSCGGNSADESVLIVGSKTKTMHCLYRSTTAISLWHKGIYYQFKVKIELNLL